MSLNKHGFIEENLSKRSEACPNHAGMATGEVNGLHFPTSIPNKGNDPVDKRPDAAASRTIGALHAKIRRNAD